MRCRAGEEIVEKTAHKEIEMTSSQFRQALETLAFTDGSRMAVQLASGQIISGHFQTMLTNGDMVWFTEERDAEERQWLIDVAPEPWTPLTSAAP
jgi:hypothetical protein